MREHSVHTCMYHTCMIRFFTTIKFTMTTRVETLNFQIYLELLAFSKSGGNLVGWEKSFAINNL